MRDIFADRAAEVSLFGNFISGLGEIIHNPGALRCIRERRAAASDPPFAHFAKGGNAQTEAAQCPPIA